MSRGKQGVASANRRAGQAEHDATTWRHRALTAEADTRGYKRTAAMYAKRVEDLEALLATAERDRDAAASDETRRLAERLEAEQQRLERLAKLIVQGDRNQLAFSSDQFGELREILGPELFTRLIRPDTRSGRRTTRRAPRDVRLTVAEAMAERDQ